MEDIREIEREIDEALRCNIQTDDPCFAELARSYIALIEADTGKNLRQFSEEDKKRFKYLTLCASVCNQNLESVDIVF